MLQAPQKAFHIFILVGHNWAHWLVTEPLCLVNAGKPWVLSLNQYIV